MSDGADDRPSDRPNDRPDDRHRSSTPATSEMGMTGYSNRSYGEAFADVYDHWYADVSPIDATVALLTSYGGDGPFLELGVGTGRLALPLAAAAHPRAVWGIDASPQMLDELAAKPGADSITIIEGDMIDDLPDERFSVIFAAYNTFFNLPTAEAQARAFHEISHRLRRGGRFIVEAYVPPDPFPERDEVAVRSMTATDVVLSVTRHEPDIQRASGQFIEFRDGELPRLRPWLIRYATVAQLDHCASSAGLYLEARWADVKQRPFDDDASRHVSVYRTPN